MLILEDGSGLSDSNSYITLSFADAFFSERGLDDALLIYNSFLDKSVQAWVGEPEAREAAIIRATDHIDAVYSVHFLGEPEKSTQSLAWPRTGFGDTLPKQLQRATALYALRALQGTLIPDPGRETSSKDVEITSGIRKKREKIGPIEEEIEYTSGAGEQRSQIIYFHEVLTPVSYPEADLLLQVLLKPESRQSPTHPSSKDDDCPKGFFGTGVLIR